MDINLMKIVVCVYIFITLGVYLKLLNYKAPKSSIIYAPILPILSIIITSKILYKDIKEIKMKKFFKIIIFIVLEVQAIINNYMYTGLLCVVLGEGNVGIIKIIKVITRKIGGRIILSEIENLISAETKIEEEAIYKRVINMA